MALFLNPKYPQERLGGSLAFRNGRIKTDNPEEIAIVRICMGSSPGIVEVKEAEEATLRFGASVSALAVLKQAAMTVDQAAEKLGLEPGATVSVKAAKNLLTGKQKEERARETAEAKERKQNLDEAATALAAATPS